MTKTRLTLATTTIALAVSGCASTGSIADLFMPIPDMARTMAADQCGARAVSYHVGHSLTADVDRDIREHARQGQQVQMVRGLYHGASDPASTRMKVYYHGDNRVINAIVCG